MAGFMYEIRAIPQGTTENGIICCAKCGSETRRGLCVATTAGPICISCIEALVQGGK